MKTNPEISRILAATDFSEYASAALAYATQIALRFSAELTVDEHDADLLVLGARRKQSLNRSILGFTTEELTRLAICPVLTVPLGTVPSGGENET